MPSSSNKLSRRLGFTLVEIMVVVPIVILVIGVLVVFLVTLTGDALMARERSSVAYTTQDALNRIEQDIRISTNFLPTSGTMISPQGSNGGTAAFSSPSSQLIIQQYATNGNSFYDARNLVYYSNRPNSCGGDYQYNEVMKVMIVYFVDDGDLRRRTISTPETATCDGGFTSVGRAQYNSCKVTRYVNDRCRVQDDVLASNVTDFSITYYTAANTTVPVSSIESGTASALVNLTISKNAAGETIENSGAVRVTKLNVP